MTAGYVPPNKSPGYWPLVPAVSALTVTVTTVNFLGPLLVALQGEFGISVAEAGQLVVATTLAWAAGAPFAGLLSDRFGRRPVIVVALLGMAVTTLAAAFVSDFRMLAGLRLLTGVFGCGGPPSIMAAVADLYPPHKRGLAIGWTNTSFSFASLIGVPAVGAIIGGLWGWRASFIAAGLALLLMVVLVRLAFPAGQRGSAGAGSPWMAYGHLTGLRGLGPLLASNVLERFTFMVLTLYFAAFLIQTFGLDPIQVAPALFLTGIGTIAGTLAGGFIADRFSRARIAAGSLALTGIFGLATFLWPVHLAWTVAAGVIFGLADAAGRPAFIALLFGLSEKHRGALVGVVAGTNQLGFAVGAGVGGAVIGLAGYPGIALTLLFAALAGSGLILLAQRGAAAESPSQQEGENIPRPNPLPAGQGQTRATRQGEGVSSSRFGQGPGMGSVSPPPADSQLPTVSAGPGVKAVVPTPYALLPTTSTTPGLIVQTLVTASHDRPGVARLSLAPGRRIQMPAGGGGLILPLWGSGSCRTVNDEVALAPGSVVDVPEGATPDIEVTGEWPLVVLVIGPLADSVAAAPAVAEPVPPASAR